MSARTPAEISGAIRLRAELIVARYQAAVFPDPIVDDVQDAQRILELLNELDAAMLKAQLEASVRAVKP